MLQAPKGLAEILQADWQAAKLCKTRADKGVGLVGTTSFQRCCVRQHLCGFLSAGSLALQCILQIPPLWSLVQHIRDVYSSNIARLPTSTVPVAAGSGVEVEAKEQCSPRY